MKHAAHRLCRQLNALEVFILAQGQAWVVKTQKRTRVMLAVSPTQRTTDGKGLNGFASTCGHRWTNVRDQRSDQNNMMAFDAHGEGIWGSQILY